MEEDVLEQQAADSPVKEAMEDLIEAMEGTQVHGMDDRRMSSSSSEESMIVRDDDDDEPDNQTGV